MSWLSPLGWSQQTAPFTLDRWWPLAISLAAAILLAIAAFVLQSRRDLAAGIWPDRLGEATAPTWLRSPLSLAFRLQRTGLAWWSFALLAAGIIFGAFVQPMAQNAAGMPEEILTVFGGADQMVDGYLGFMSLYYALMAAVYAILSIQALRGEEQATRTEPILATSVSRTSWLLSWTTITACGTLWLLALAGLGNGLGAALSTGDWSLPGSVLLGEIIQTPAVWALAGLAVALYGLAPRLIGITWAVFVYAGILSIFGAMMKLNDTVLATSVFHHIGQYPAEAISWTAVGALTLIAAILTAAGTGAFTRRDLITA